MSETQTVGNGHETDADKGTGSGRQKRKRSPSTAKSIYVVMQVMGDDGAPMVITKERVKLLAIERTSDKVLDMIDSGEYPNAFYLRTMMQPIR